MKNLKKIPEFKSEREEFEFWTKTDTTDFINWNESKPAIFPNLKKSTRGITIDFPVNLLEKLNIRANKIGVPFESLVKMYILKAYYDSTQSFKL